MTFSTIATLHVQMTAVVVTDDLLTVKLSDGRTISAPLSWFPRLCHGDSDERSDWRLIGSGRGIHWPRLGEDISVDNLIFGKPSAESQKSLKRWIASRTSGQNINSVNPSGGSGVT